MHRATRINRIAAFYSAPTEPPQVRQAAPSPFPSARRADRLNPLASPTRLEGRGAVLPTHQIGGPLATLASALLICGIGVGAVVYSAAIGLGLLPTPDTTWLAFIVGAAVAVSGALAGYGALVSLAVSVERLESTSGQATGGSRPSNEFN